MNRRLAGKVALVTGASSGIGRATALRYGIEGAHVVINYRRSASAAESLVQQLSTLGASAVAWQADVSSAEDVAAMVAGVLARFGRIDILAAIAGADILTGSGSDVADSEKLERLIDVDLKGTMQCCWQLAPIMQAAGGGAIVTMSWDLALHGMAGRNPQMFAAVKAGVVGFSKCLALTYAPQVRINILAPGWIETEFVRDVMTSEARAEVLTQTPLQRFGTPEDVANAALFLASEESAFITGQILYINGGIAT